MPLPPTTSGAARLVELSDDEAWRLEPGHLAIVQDGRGLAPLLVTRVRVGVAFDDSNPPRAYEVPVIEGCQLTGPLERKRPLVWATPDCLIPAPYEAEAESAEQDEAALTDDRSFRGLLMPIATEEGRTRVTPHNSHSSTHGHG